MNEITPKPPYGCHIPKFGGEGMGKFTDDCLIHYRSTNEWFNVLATGFTNKNIFYPSRYYTRPIDPGPDHELVGEDEIVTLDDDVWCGNSWYRKADCCNGLTAKQFVEKHYGWNILAIRRPKKPVPQPQSEWPKYWAINGKFVYRKLALSTRQEQWTGIEWVPTSETISTPMKPITPEQAAEITGEGKPAESDAKATDTQWHFPSKGEFPEADSVIEYSFNTTHREITTVCKASIEMWKESPDGGAYCWRYCDPLPPIPEVKAEDDGFEKWWINKGYQETRADKGDARITWLAAQSALLNKDKEKK